MHFSNLELPQGGWGYRFPRTRTHTYNSDHFFNVVGGGGAGVQKCNLGDGAVPFPLSISRLKNWKGQVKELVMKSNDGKNGEVVSFSKSMQKHGETCENKIFHRCKTL